jgi:hypothetical protein
MQESLLTPDLSVAAMLVCAPTATQPTAITKNVMTATR